MKKFLIAVGIVILVAATVLYFVFTKSNPPEANVLPYLSVVAYDDKGQAIEYRDEVRREQELSRSIGFYDFKTTIGIKRGQEVLFSKSADHGDWLFAIWEHGPQKCRVYYNFAMCGDDLQEYLTNPGSNENRRYLVLCHAQCGSTRMWNEIYILDPDNNFSLIAEFDDDQEGIYAWDLDEKCNCRNHKGG